jgi:hypothetical protein
MTVITHDQDDAADPLARSRRERTHPRSPANTKSNDHDVVIALPKSILKPARSFRPPCNGSVSVQHFGQKISDFVVIFDEQPLCGSAASAQSSRSSFLRLRKFINVTGGSLAPEDERLRARTGPQSRPDQKHLM